MKILRVLELTIFILIRQYFYKWLSTLIFIIMTFQLLRVFSSSRSYYVQVNSIATGKIECSFEMGK